jgi:hypothetical protein
MTDLDGSPVQLYSENTTFTVIVPMHGGVRWLNIYNGSSGELAATIDLGPAVWNYCSEINWTDPYCETVDIDDNDVADEQETADWVPEERIRSAAFEDRPDLIVVPEAAPKQDGSALYATAGGVIAVFGSAFAAGIIILIFILIVAIMLRKRKKK